MDITESLNVLSQHYPVAANDSRTELLSRMLEIIREKTKQFTDPSGLSKEPVDLKSILEKEGIKPAEWQQAKGSIDRTEVDTVSWLAHNIKRIINPLADAATVRARKAKALLLKLQLINFNPQPQ
jgi:hypothetical protein